MKASFSDKVLRWFDQHGRKNLPWQQDISAYRVWVSEIMLQQTQVKTVIPYFERFMQSFPDVHALANAEQDTVLKHWSGLGYYARARNMHKAAKMIRDDFGGEFPNTLDEMVSLSGIGRSTAAAILSIACNQKEAILDGNVKRVLCRAYIVEGWPGKSAVLKQLWEIADALVPDSRNADYTQAMMDLGATLCTRSKPQCVQCPLNDDCLAYKQGNQTEYPAKKPKKTLPTKQTTMLIIQDKSQSNVNAIYMEKRPPVGIWGGLWCFPQFESTIKAYDWLQKHYGIKPKQTEELNAIQHVFSHFRLQIKPLIITVETPLTIGVMENDDKLWYNITTEFHGGLAAPVQQLIQQLKENSNGKNG